jgi:hypothetical protein
MKNFAYRRSGLGLLVLLVIGATTASRAQVSIPLDRQVGEIFVAVGNGQYQVWHPTPPTVAFVETVIDGAGSGATAGCAFNSTYHPFTTNVTANDVFKDMIDDPQTDIQTISVVPAGGAQPTSIALDSAGNSYVGLAGGNGLIEEYGPSGSLVQTLPVSTSTLKGGSPWMDLSTDAQTIYFTNLSNTITQFKVSSSKTSKFATVSGATLYALRVLPAATQKATGGLLLVAAVFSSSSNIQLLNSSGATINSYSVPGENNFQVLTLDPNGASFWAGNPTTHNFYRINLAGGPPEVSALSATTGITSGPSGLCAYGGFSAAQPQPINVTAALTPGSPQCTVPSATNTMDCTFSTVLPPPTFPTPPEACSPTTSTTNCFAITLNGINLNNAPTGLQLAYNYSQIAQAAGSSDTGTEADEPSASLLCELTSPDGTKCEVHSVDVTPNNGSSDHNIYQSFDLATFSTQPAVNPVMLKNEVHGLTDLIIHGTLKISGSDTTKSIFTLNEQPITVAGSQSCGYISPVLNSQFNQGRTIPFKFQAVTFPNTCASGPFITNLQARLELVQFSNFSTPNAAPHHVNYTLANGTFCTGTETEDPACFYRLDPTSNTWILNVDSSSLQGGGTMYVGTTFDDSNQIPTFSVTQPPVVQPDIFTVK